METNPTFGAADYGWWTTWWTRASLRKARKQSSSNHTLRLFAWFPLRFPYPFLHKLFNALNRLRRTFHPLMLLTFVLMQLVTIQITGLFAEICQYPSNLRYVMMRLHFRVFIRRSTVWNSSHLERQILLLSKMCKYIIIICISFIKILPACCSDI